MSDTTAPSSFVSLLMQRLSASGVVFRTALVTVIAMVLRLIFLYQFQDNPLFDTHIMDMSYFYRLATDGIADTGFPAGPFFKAPLYPLFLKMIYTVFGDGPWPLRIIQTIMGSLSAGLTCLITKRIFSSLRIATIAGLLVAVCGTLILYDGQILVPTLTIFLNLIAIYALVVASQTRHMFLFAVSGLTLGLSAIARPTVLIFAVLVVLSMVWVVYRTKKFPGWRGPVFFVLGMILAIAPVTIRNYTESGEFVLIGTYSGINLYIGNNLKSDGVSATVPGTGLEWWENASMDDTYNIAAKELGDNITPVQQSKYWRDRAIKEMIDNPGFFARHLARKSILFLGGYELANNFDIYYLSKRIPLLKPLIPKGPIYWPWGVFLPLGLAGIVLCRQWNHSNRILVLFLISSVPAFLMFFVTARYRLPLIPILAIFAAFAIDTVLSKFRGISLRRIVATIATFIIVLLICHWDPLEYAEGTESQGHQMMASMYRQQGDLANTEKYYYLALAEDPTLPHAHNDLGLLLMERGDYEQSLLSHQRAVHYRPDDWALQYNLGLALMNNGRLEESIPRFKIALEQAPNFYGGANNLGLVYNRLGFADSAAIAYRTATQIDPYDYRGFFALGLCYQILQQRDSALTYYQKAQHLNPEYSRTFFNLGRLWQEELQIDSAQYYMSKFLQMQPNLPDLEEEAQKILNLNTGDIQP